MLFRSEEIDLEKALTEIKPNLEIAEGGEERQKKPNKKRPLKKKVEPKKDGEEVNNKKETKSESEGE